MICPSSGQPIPLSQEDPLESLRLSVRPDDGPVQQWKDIEKYKAIAESLRKIGVLAISPGGSRKAHEALDDMLRDIQRSSLRLADVQVADTGVSKGLALQLKYRDINTIQDLANCEPAEVMRSINIMDILKAMKAGLRFSIEVVQAEY